MDSEIKALWTGALRSGDYVQGRHALRDDDDKFCCLGVLCEIAAQKGAIEQAYMEPDSTLYTYDYTTSFLPSSVSKWAGMPDAFDERQKLMEMNDKHRLTFPEIADWIDENL